VLQGINVSAAQVRLTSEACMKKLLSGNEAIARGAYEYGVKVAAGYPGTPSTEILENLAKYDGVYVEWSPNEKVALEVAIGASLTGIRTMATMKHVGLNVASDPLMTSSYTGTEGGLVVVVADDPGMHSSQNEQDSRNYARFAKVPLFEPSDSNEAKRFIKEALNVSEKFDTPALLRSTTRISHSKGVVEINDRSFKDRVPHYNRNPEKYLMVPAYARKRRLYIEERTKKLLEYANSFRENKFWIKDPRLGIITSGISYQYVMEAFPDASVLKIALSYPFPDALIRSFASEVEKILVVEELDDFMAEHIRSLGIQTIGDGLIPRIGELSPDILKRARDRLEAGTGSYSFSSEDKKEAKQEDGETDSPLPARPPVLCPGCGHRTVFYVLKKFKPVIIGDIGCYALGGLSPLDSMDAIICMGAGISSAMGVAKSGLKRPVVGIVGDSTFFHSGITGLLDIGYNRGNLTVIVLDNRVTAMTGHQEHPGTGVTLSGETTYRASIEKFGLAAGFQRIKVFDPYNLEETKKVIKTELECGEPSLLISRRPCVLITDKTGSGLSGAYTVDPGVCNACGLCLKLGCPAIEKKIVEYGKWIALISRQLCTGCSVCEQVCSFEAIGIEKQKD
jgi:indolepyruvate ferredoxin oxidoreductase alpha subunit